jgi:NTE family protein
MLRALVETGVEPDLLVGTSIGAINGAAFAGEPTLEGVYLAAEVWRRIAASDVFPRRRFHGTWRFLERRPGVFSMDGLRTVVAGYLRFELLEDAPVPLLVVATRLDDGKEEWITEGSALDAIMASAALPGLYPVAEIGDRRYFDGGVLDNVAISAALAAGAERIYVLMCGRVDPPAAAFTRPFEAMFSAFTMALGARLRRDLAAIPPGVDVIVMEQPGTVMFDPGDFSHTDELIDQGYRAARDVLAEYDRVRRHEAHASLHDERERLGGRLRRAASVRRGRPQGGAQLLMSDAPDAPGAPGAPNAAERADDDPSGSTE